MLLYYTEPTGFDVPSVVGIGPRYVDLMWTQPLNRNGILREYNIYQNGQFRQSVSDWYYTVKFPS